MTPSNLHFGRMTEVRLSIACRQAVPDTLKVGFKRGRYGRKVEVIVRWMTLTPSTQLRPAHMYRHWAKVGSAWMVGRDGYEGLSDAERILALAPAVRNIVDWFNEHNRPVDNLDELTKYLED